MFHFKKLTPTLFRTTEKEWMIQIEKANGEIFASHYRQVLDRGKKSIKKQCDKNLYTYALTQKENPDLASAILEISHACPTAEAPWLKLLAINIAPSFDAVYTPDSRVLAKIVATAITESFELTFTDCVSEQLKVYCATPFSIEFVEGVCSGIKNFDGVNFSTSGNWFVIK